MKVLAVARVVIPPSQNGRRISGHCNATLLAWIENLRNRGETWRHVRRSVSYDRGGSSSMIDLAVFQVQALNRLPPYGEPVTSFGDPEHKRLDVTRFGSIQ